jgi:hypothetical protein
MSTHCNCQIQLQCSPIFLQVACHDEHPLQLSSSIAMFTVLSAGCVSWWAPIAIVKSNCNVHHLSAGYVSWWAPVAQDWRRQKCQLGWRSRRFVEVLDAALQLFAGLYCLANRNLTALNVVCVWLFIMHFARKGIGGKSNCINTALSLFVLLLNALICVHVLVPSSRNHAHMHNYTSTQVYTCIHPNTHAWAFIHTHTHTYTHTHAVQWPAVRPSPELTLLHASAGKAFVSSGHSDFHACQCVCNTRLPNESKYMDPTSTCVHLNILLKMRALC